MVLRRYTPPTCTLEITAKASGLSRWAGRPVLKSLRFELRLDDPRLPEEQHIILRGDRTQLEALHEAVSTYVQDFLAQPPEGEPELVSEQVDSPLPEEPSSTDTEPKILDEGHNPFQPQTVHPPISTISALPSVRDGMQSPSLHPRGLLTHDLFLGGLIGDGAGPVVQLSALQLFDLATALDEYATELMLLPSLGRPQQQRRPPAWLSSAAVVLVTVGVTAGALKLLDRSAVEPEATQQASNPELNSGSSPRPSASSPVPTPLASLPPLPPPPLTVPSTSPSATPAPAVVTRPSPLAPPAPVFPPATPIPAAPPLQAPPANERIITIPGDLGRPASQPVAPEPPQEARIARNPVAAAPRPMTPTPPSDPALGSLDPNLAAGVELPPLQDAPLPPVTPEEDTRVAATLPKTNGTLFDALPQVAEARSYFEENWKPPEGLKDTLEYSLQVDASGSIQQITPLGQAAGDYIDRTNMPLVGEPFVSANSEGKNPRIRVVLRPSGKVQAFLEAVN